MIWRLAVQYEGEGVWSSVFATRREALEEAKTLASDVKRQPSDKISLLDDDEYAIAKEISFYNGA